MEMLPSNHSSSRDPGEDSAPDEDQGLIRCICNIDDDDGFTIQCENCLVWQHAVCVGVEQENVPDEYLCEKCNPRKLDVKRAVEYQRRRLDSETRNSKEPRKRQKSTTSKPKRSDESNDRKKRALDPKLPRSKSAKPAGAGRDSSSPTASRITDRGRDSAALADSSYTAIDSNILGADVQVLFQSVLSQLAEQRNTVSAAAASVTSTPPASLTASSATKNGTTEAAALQTNRVDSDSGKKQASEALLGTPFLNGNSNSHSSEAANEGNESALSSIAPMEFDDIDNPSPVYKALVGKERCQMGLFSGRRIERHRYVCEYKGQVLLKAAYKEDPKNYYELLRTTSPYSHFHPGIDICVDARRQGSEARFVRRSCSANVVLKSMYIPGSANPLVYLGLFAQRDVEPDEELTLGWEWEDGELPALARMSPSDAEDYLGRPEGRRLSKVWRQAFAGVSCACPDQQCEVRRLFALLNVEELSVKPDIGGPLKRRTSRTTRPDSIAADLVNQDPPSPSSSNVQSLDDHTPIRGSHSRKGSAASGVLNGRTLRETSVDVESNSNVSVRSSSQLGHSLASRDTNASRNSEALHGSDDANSDNDYEAEKSNGQPDNASNEGTDVAESALAGSGDLRPRKRKLSDQPVVDPIAPADMESRNGNSSKMHRLSVSSVASRRTSQSTVLPLKKLWMNKYLEVCSEPRIISQDGENMTIAENPPPHSTDMAATQPAQVLRRGSSISRRGSVYEEPREPDGVDLLDTADSGPAKAEPPHASSTAESGRNIIKSEPTDADAPTPPPTNSPPGLASLEQNAITPQAPVDSAASDSKPAPQAVDDDSSTQNKDQIAPNVPEGTTETSPDVAQRTSSPAAEQASIPPPKKQRLSLQEYNKRRRVNNPTVSSKEAESKDASVVNTPEAASAPAASEEPALQTADHSMATNDGSVLTAPVPVRPASTVYTETGAPSRGESTTPPLPPALLASTEGIMPKGNDSMSSQQRLSRSPKLADSPAARALSSSLPPSMTMAEAVSGGGSSSAGRGDERPRSSTGYSNGPRIERSSTGAAYDAGGAYRPRERDYGHHDAPGSVERESGEIAHRRERMRSSSRGRGERDRERRHNTFGGTSSGQYYNQPPPPPPPRSLTPHNIEGARGSQRGLGDWRPGSGYSSQRMSPSPSFYGSGPTPSSSHSQHQSQQGGGSSGAGAMSRRTGIGTEGSRGGSPLRK